MAARPVPEGRGVRRLSLRHPARHRLPTPASTASRTHDVDFFLGPNYLVTVHDGHSRVDRRAARSRHAEPEDSGRGAGRAAPPHRRRDGRLTTGRRSTSSRSGSTSSRRQIFDEPRPDAGPADPRREARGRRAAPHHHAAARRRSRRLARRDFVDISTEMSFRFRDVYDHLVRIADDAMIFQDRITGMLDAHLSNVSNRLNEVMKVLTVVVDDLHAADAAGRASGA